MAFDARAAGCMCDICPLNRLTPVPPEGNLATAKIAIVGEGPGFQEVKFGRPFIGPSGEKLAEILAANSLRRTDCWITNAILCRASTPGVVGQKQYDLPTYLAWMRMENRARKKRGEEMLADPFMCCSPRLWAEMQALERCALERKQPNGAVVIPCGNQALNALAQHTKIKRWRGSPISINPFGGEP